MLEIIVGIVIIVAYFLCVSKPKESPIEDFFERRAKMKIQEEVERYRKAMENSEAIEVDPEVEAKKEAERIIKILNEHIDFLEEIRNKAGKDNV